MRTQPHIHALVREMQEKGFNDRQAARYDRAFRAAQLAAITLMCARHGARLAEMQESVHISKRLAAEALDLMARIETSSAFVRHIHSGRRF